MKRMLGVVIFLLIIPLGLAAGSVVGSFQLLSTIANEAGADIKSLAASLNETRKRNKENLNAANQFVQAQNALESFIGSNASPRRVAAATQNRNAALAQIGDLDLRSSLASARSAEERAERLADRTAELERQTQLGQVALLIEENIKKQTSFINKLEQFFGGEQTPENALGGPNSAQDIITSLIRGVDV